MIRKLQSANHELINFVIHMYQPTNLVVQISYI